MTHKDVLTGETLATVEDRPPRWWRGRSFYLGGAAGLLVAAITAVALALTGTLSLARDVADETGSVSPARGTVEGPGFDTPEAAAEAFLEGLRDQDVEAMTNAFAIESFVEKCDYVAEIERLGTAGPFTAAVSCPFPNDDPFGRDANRLLRRNNVADEVGRVFMSRVSPHLWEGDGTTQSETIESGEAAREYQEQTEADVRGYVFAGITGITSVSPVLIAPQYASQKTQDGVARRAKPYGLAPEEYRDVALIFTLDGEPWIFTASAGQYGDRWYLISLNSVLAAILNLDLGHLGPVPSSELTD